ncbi:cytosolic leucyl tRNA synthetase, partial [Coemansia spiralis]
WITEAKRALVQSDAAPDMPTKAGNIELRPAASATITVDRVFDAEMDALTLAAGAAYGRTMYRDALTSGFYELKKAREQYVNVTANTGMHPALVRKYILRQAILLAPITPHWAEHVWQMATGNDSSIMAARWPTDLPANPDYALLAAGDYVQKIPTSVREAESALQRRSKKKGPAAAEVDPSQPRVLDVFVARDFPAWQEDVIGVLKDNYDVQTGAFADKQVLAALGAQGMLKNKKVMPFAQEIKKRVALIGPQAFDRAVQFQEAEILREVLPYLKRSLDYSAINIIDLASAGDLSEAQTRAAEPALPGEPSFLITNAQ